MILNISLVRPGADDAVAGTVAEFGWRLILS